MSESGATRIETSVSDECRRLAELLDLDAVGVTTSVSGARRVVCWSTPDSPAIPENLDDVIEGRLEGWEAHPVGKDSFIFARITPQSSARAGTVLQAVGSALASALADAFGSAEPGTAQPSTEAPVARWSDDTAAVTRMLTAGRKVMENPEGTLADLLFSVREALFADEVFHVIEQSGDLVVTSSPPSEKSRRIPKEIRTTLQSLSRSEPVEEASARQLAVVLGAQTPFVCSAFCRDDESIETLLVGWRDKGSVSPTAMKLIAHVFASGRAALEARRQAVDSLVLRERNRWAYEIHDGVTQAVTTSVLELEALSHKIARDPSEAIETIAASKAEIRKSLSELRGILFELSRDKPAEVPQDEPLTKYVQDVVRRWRLPARVTIKGDLHHVPKPLLGAAYVVIREALANAAKHASARAVTVWVSASSDELLVEVGDTGRGFKAGGRRGAQSRHFGLEMMSKRVDEVGGTLEVESSPGNGTRVVARLPIKLRGEQA